MESTQKIQLKKILTLYGIESFDLLNDNKLYGSPNREISRFLIKSKDKFILRKYLNTKKKILIKRAELYEFFSKNHFPHIEFLPLVNGKKILEEDNYLYTLEKYIENSPIIRPEYVKDLEYAEKIVKLYGDFINIPHINNFYEEHFSKVDFIHKVSSQLDNIHRLNGEIYELFNDDFNNILQLIKRINPTTYKHMHGDFHPKNMLFSKTETILIDWEFTGIGIEFYDLGLCAGCVFADSPDKYGIKFIETLLENSDLKDKKNEIMIIAYITRLFWIVEWIRNKDIEALKWEKYILYELKELLK